MCAFILDSVEDISGARVPVNVYDVHESAALDGDAAAAANANIG